MPDLDPAAINAAVSDAHRMINSGGQVAYMTVRTLLAALGAAEARAAEAEQALADARAGDCGHDLAAFDDLESAVGRVRAALTTDAPPFLWRNNRRIQKHLLTALDGPASSPLCGRQVGLLRVRCALPPGHDGPHKMNVPPLAPAFHSLDSDTRDTNEAGMLYTCSGCHWGWRTHDPKDAERRWSKAHTTGPEGGDS